MLCRPRGRHCQASAWSQPQPVEAVTVAGPEEEARLRGVRECPRVFGTVRPLQPQLCPGLHRVQSLRAPSGLAICGPCEDLTQDGYLPMSWSACSHIWANYHAGHRQKDPQRSGGRHSSEFSGTRTVTGNQGYLTK